MTTADFGPDESECDERLREAVDALRTYHDEDSAYGRMNQDEARAFAADFIDTRLCNG